MQVRNHLVSKYQQPLVLRLAIWSDNHPRLCSGLSYAVIFGLVLTRMLAKAHRVRRVLVMKEGMQQDAA